MIFFLIKGEFLLKSMESETVHKTVLEQLRNKEFRKKAWHIYYGSEPDRKNFPKNEEMMLQKIDERIENIHAWKMELKSKNFLLEDQIIKTSGIEF